MSIWRELRELALRATWVERLVVAYCVAMTVVEGTRGDWSHAATYLLAASCEVTSAFWRQASLDAAHLASAWKRMFYDLRDRTRRTP